jgi:chromosome segregation ATPase
MEKTTQSSQQSAPDYVKLSHRSTPENPGLYGGMKPNDRASTSDGSRSQHDERMLDFMQMMRREKLDVAKQLEQANQENGKLQKNIQDLTNRLKQANRDKQDLDNQLKEAHRENEKLANQLKEARLGGTSSLQEGESSSQSIKEKELAREAMRKWFAEKLKR